MATIITKKHLAAACSIFMMISVLIPVSFTTGVTISPNETITAFFIQDLLERIDENLMSTYIQTLQDFGPRVTGTEACSMAREYIVNEFQAMGYPVKTRIIPSGSYVEATLNGTDTSSDKIYIICGHYDTVSSSPGADDNGSGTAAVLAAAKVISETGEEYRIEDTIRFVTFSGEEQGLHGSDNYARDAYEKEDNIVAVLNADMIGYTESLEGKNSIRIYEVEESSWVTNFTITIAEMYKDYLSLDILRLLSGANSDHWSFLNYGYDAIFYHESDSNPYYHSPGDTIDKLDLGYTARATRLIVATLLHLTLISQIDVEKPVIKITKPRANYLYINDREICPSVLGKTIIFGKISLMVTAWDNESGIQEIEFYLDDTLRYSDNIHPYEWLWNDTIFGGHTIKITGYDNAGNHANDELNVFTINIAS